MKGKMKERFLAVALCVALVVFTFGCSQEAPKQEPPKQEAAKPAPAEAPAPAQAPVAGSAVLGVTVTEMQMVVNGWSVTKQLLGKDVYNDKGEKVGKVEDLIIAPDKSIAYGIVSAGGFLGMDKNDVAIPASQFKMAEGKITLPGATKDAIKAMPKFQYAK